MANGRLLKMDTEMSRLGIKGPGPTGLCGQKL